MTRLEEIIVIKNLHQQGLSISEIARRTVRGRKTLRKFIQQGLKPPT